MKTLTEIIAQDPQDPVCFLKGHPVGAATFALRIEEWQGKLRRLPLGPVALMFSNTAHFAAALLACWREGRSAFIPTDIRPETLNRLDGVVSAFLGEFGGRTSPIPLTEIPPSAPHDLPTPAVIVFTSGSSGEPCAISKTFGQLEAEIFELNRLWGSNPSGHKPAVLATVSHQHIYGLLFKLLWPLCSGRPFWGETLFFPEEIDAARSKVNSAVFVSSPAHLKRLPGKSVSGAVWQAVYSSGGPLDWQAAQRSRTRFGTIPIEVYGSSETGGIAWRQRQNENDPWIPFSGMQLSINADSHTLEVASPYLPSGVTFTTADVADLDLEKKHFTLKGRADRLVKIEEKRVSLDAIERSLCSCGLAEQARVFPLDAEAGGGRRLELAAVVQPSLAGWKITTSEGRKGLIKKYKDLAFQVVDRVALPRHFRLVDSLPQNSQGKTPLSQLKALFGPENNLLQRRGAIVKKKSEKNKLTLSLVIPSDLEGFKGHFPGYPVLPGVEQVDWVCAWAVDAFKPAGVFKGLEKLKFRKIIQPGQDLEVELEYVSEKNIVKFEYRSTEGFHASGRILFGKEGP